MEMILIAYGWYRYLYNFPFFLYCFRIQLIEYGFNSMALEIQEMAANSLFSCFRGKKYSYTPNGKAPVDKLLHVKPLHFSSMDKPPASKKRRMESDDDWDDDDFELTQKDLESIATVEIMASQSASNNNMMKYQTDPGPSGAALSFSNSTAPKSAPGRLPQSTKYSFVKPRPTNSSMSSSESLNPHSTSGSRVSTSSSKFCNSVIWDLIMSLSLSFLKTSLQN